MFLYEDRIPVTPAYAQALGEVVYNFATVEWMVVYLGSLIDPQFVNTESGTDFGSLAREFEILSGTGKYPEFTEISKRFTVATARRKDLEKSIPITAQGGAQVLDGTENSKDYQWSEENVVGFAKELEALDIEANALYYRLKPA